MRFALAFSYANVHRCLGDWQPEWPPVQTALNRTAPTKGVLVRCPSPGVSAPADHSQGSALPRTWRSDIGQPAWAR